MDTEFLKNKMNDEGILDGVMQWVVLAVVFTILPGLLYAVSSAQPVITSGVWNTTQSTVNSTTSSSFGTLVIVLIVLAIVIIISVLLLLGGMRRK